MNLKTVFAFVVLFFSLAVGASTMFGESTTLTTYYPAPFGAYDRIRYSPRESLPRDPYCNDEQDLGLMYYDNGQKEMKEGLYLCQKFANGDTGWGRAVVPVVNDAKVTTVGKVVCLKTNGEFGTCMNNPSFDGSCGCN